MEIFRSGDLPRISRIYADGFRTIRAHPRTEQSDSLPIRGKKLWGLGNGRTKNSFPLFPAYSCRVLAGEAAYAIFAGI
jgi:hypothetical protein